MSQISTHTVISSYLTACKKHGESETARVLAIMLLEEIANVEAAYSAASERKATEAEYSLAQLTKEG